MRCLVLGATGYVGGRLVPRLLAEGHEVRCLARDPRKLRDVPWADQVEIAAGDVLDEAGLAAACAGIDVVYYLVHSMTEPGFAALDRRGALLTAQAARRADVCRIVYLGGLQPDGDDTPSRHLASRAEVGEVFLRAPVPAAVLRAAVITGSGSTSFEMLRHLTDRLPVMLTPRWVGNRTQPIAVADVLRYLVACAALPREVNRSFDIGGPDVLSYLEMMQRYARIAGLPRRITLPLPLLTPGLSAAWVALVTPVPRALAMPLIESMAHDLTCREHDIAGHVPDPPGGLLDYEASVRRALPPPPDAAACNDPATPVPTDPPGSGGPVYTQRWELPTGASAAGLWRVIEGIGGRRGWHTVPLAFELRGWLDQLLGGVGAHRGRRDPDRVRTGEVLDWWRVENVEHGRTLLLRAEMRMPGTAWLQLGVHTGPEGRATLRQEVTFVPGGLTGQLYWWAQRPAHDVVFGVMAGGIAAAAERDRIVP